MVTTKNIAEVIRRELEADPKLAVAVEAEVYKAKVGAEIYQAREQAGLTQKQLAELANMKQSAIARLENADYDGHSLKALERVAAALDKQIEIHFVDKCQIIATEVFNIDYQNQAQSQMKWNANIKITGSFSQSNNLIPVA